MALLRTFLAGTTGPGLRSPLTALLLPAAIGASAQLFSSSAPITITTGADVHVQGGLRNHGNGVVSNDGTLYVSGDLTHDATGTCFGASAGEVVLDGGAQSIGGVSGIVFNDLTLAGTGDKTLLRDTEVGGAYPGPAGVLQLSDRRLLLNSHTLAVHTGSSSAVQRTTGFIVSETDPLLGYGTLRWDIGQQAVAGNEFVFPFGNAVSGDYLPVSVTITDPGTGVSGWLALSAYPTDPTPSPNNRPLPTGLSVLTDLGGAENAPSVMDRWWVMATGGYAQAPVADLRFTYRDSEWNSGLNLITEATLMLQDLWNGVWQHPPSVVSPVANTLSTTGRTLRNGPWTAATAGSPLPIELLAFTGERVDPREVMLRWSTATEQDNAGFEVWRMIEGEEGFRQVGWVDGAGDSQAKLDYTLPDDNPTRYVSYYKLRQVDLDGQSAWSPTVAVLGTSTEGRYVLFPNPANDRFFVDTDPDGIRSVLLLDGSGRRVKEWSWQPQGFTVDDLPAGLYTVVLAGTDGSTRQQKLMIGR